MHRLLGKTLLGIGYILAAIPYVNIIGVILVAIGWYTLGKDKDRGLWKATGLLGIIAFILVIVAIAVGASAIFAAMSDPEAAAHALAANAGAVIALIIAAIFLVIFGILQLICLWQFSNEYSSTLVKVAVILYILTIVIALAAIPAAITMGAEGMIAILGAGILGFIAGILAGIGILTAKEPVTTQPTPTQAPPPPLPPQ